MRKSNQQIEQDRRHMLFSFRGAAIWFTITFIGFIATIFSPRNAQGFWPQDWGRFLLDVCFIAAIVAVAIYLIQIIFRVNISFLGIKQKTVICNNCHRVKNIDGIDKCECGGTFDNFDNWMWVDDPSDTESMPGT